MKLFVCESVTDLSKRFQSVTKLKRLPYYDQYSSFLYISSDCCLTEQCCLIGFQLKKSSLYNYENMFFVLFDYQVYLKVT